MSFFATRDGTELFYVDWAPGQAPPAGREGGATAGGPVVFVTGWGLCSPFWGRQMVALNDRGVRCIAYDRRGHGRSDDPGRGYDIDTLADDLAALVDRLDLRGATLVAHSMGCGEVVRYLSRHGSGRVARVAFVGASLPFLAKTADNPDGLDAGLVEHVRAAWIDDYPKWLADNAPAFFTPDTSPETVQWGVNLMLQPSLRALLSCGRVNVETDFRPELAALDVPALFIHGTSDASNPLELCSRRAAALAPRGRLAIYEGAPHGLPITHADRFNRDLLAFLDDALR
jgi:non-heme chloroperoxidase